jgi:hypothetical protein
VSNTGVAGFTLGGGFGWTSGKCCYAADNLVSVDIVTADGERRHASKTENADLFWALGGGGGNFGAVTSFEFGAHPHGPQALCGMVVYPMSQARDVAHQFCRVATAAPDELCCLLMLRIAPAAPFLPEALHGTPIAAIAACWTGDPIDRRDAMYALKSFARAHGNRFEFEHWSEDRGHLRRIAALMRNCDQATAKPAGNDAVDLRDRPRLVVDRALCSPFECGSARLRSKTRQAVRRTAHCDIANLIDEQALRPDRRLAIELAEQVGKRGRHGIKKRVPLKRLVRQAMRAGGDDEALGKRQTPGFSSTTKPRPSPTRTRDSVMP